MSLFKPGDRVYILTDWEGFYGESFLVERIKIDPETNITRYYQDNEDWSWYEEEGSFNGWWSEDVLTDNPDQLQWSDDEEGNLPVRPDGDNGEALD